MKNRERLWTPLSILIMAVFILSGMAAFAEDAETAAEGEGGVTIEGLIQEKKYQEAINLGNEFIANFTEAGRGGDLTAGLYINMGVAHFNLKQYSEAIVAYDKAFEMDMFDTKSLEYKATCQHELGDTDGEIETLRQILDAMPENEDEVKFKLAHLLEDAERIEEAYPLYDELVESDPAAFDNIAADVGIMYLNANKREKAVAALGKALEVDAGHENANLAMGKIHMKNKDNAEKVKAIPYLKKWSEVTKNEQLKGNVQKIIVKLETIQKELGGA